MTVTGPEQAGWQHSSGQQGWQQGLRQQLGLQQLGWQQGWQQLLTQLGLQQVVLQQVVLQQEGWQQGEQQELVMVLDVEVLFTGVPEILTAVSVLGLLYPGHVMKGPISRTFPCCLFSTVQGEILTEGSTP